jgi:predicted MPP superfamily phosphohydrolase
MTPVRVAVFLSVVLSIVASIHYYIWARLVRDAAWPPPWPAVGTWLVVLLAVALPAGMFFRRSLPRGPAAPLTWAVSIWMGVMFLLLVLLASADLALGIVAAVEAASSGVGLSGTPRQVLSRYVAGTALTGAVGLAAVGMATALSPVRVKRVRVALDRLPPRLSGFTIVQMSDIHVGPTIGMCFVEQLVERCNALDADVIVLTGDLADGPVGELAPLAAPLGRLRARHGVFFVTGNHDYYSGVESWVAYLESLGLRALRNERVTIEQNGAAFDLAGVEDYSAGAFGRRPDLAAALAGRDASRPVVLLAHQPKAIHEAAEMGVDLQISGHTHGGQIFPFRFLVRLAQPYVSGLYDHGGTRLYVSNGTGYWGPPMRVGAPPEITRIELASA